ncbi:MAG: S8 family serine peptidase, partial [Bacteroidia bacterium]|nr:S8 family serine peptidase [Bacteroidia bacterium]
AEALKKALSDDRENVDYVEPNVVMGLYEPIASQRLRSRELEAVEPNDPRAPEQWALQASGESAAFARLSNLRPKKRAKVAILDTGVDGGHEDLKSAFGTSPGDGDRHGHGTHCAGIAGAVTHNGKGVASLNWGGRFVEIRGYYALDERGSGSIERIAQAIVDAAEARMDVLSLSLGGRSLFPPRVMVKAVEYARRLGCIVVVAAGNSNDDASRYSPANVPGVICVAATDAENRKADFSNVTKGLEMAVSAPGVDILSLKPGGNYVSMSGTSMATPMVAGILGVMRALRPELDAQTAYNILRSTGRAPNGSDLVGPIVNADAAIAAVLRLP